MIILDSAKSDLLRNEFCNAFLKLDSEYYANLQREAEMNSKQCYSGYLWDCVKNNSVVPEKEAMRLIETQFRHVYVMWDRHDQDKVRIQNYWKYPQFSILELSSDEFRKLVDTLPEDVYVFDNRFSECVILTHEWIDDERFCYYVTKDEQENSH